MTVPEDGVTNRAYLAGRVMRYAGWPTLCKQSVGEHSHAVAYVYEQIFGPPRAEVERYIRYHDAAELVVGDPPFPIKAQNPDLKAAYDRIEPAALERMGVVIPEITPEERVKVKVADLLEMTIFGMVEEEMGNRLAAPITRRTMEAARSLAFERLSSEDHDKVRKWVAGEIDRHHKLFAGVTGDE